MMDTWLRIVLDSPLLKESLLQELDKRILSCYLEEDRATGSMHDKLVGKREALREMSSFIKNSASQMPEVKDEMALEKGKGRRRKDNARTHKGTTDTG